MNCLLPSSEILTHNQPLLTERLNSTECQSKVREGNHFLQKLKDKSQRQLYSLQKIDFTSLRPTESEFRRPQKQRDSDDSTDFQVVREERGGFFLDKKMVNPIQNSRISGTQQRRPNTISSAAAMTSQIRINPNQNFQPPQFSHISEQSLQEIGEIKWDNNSKYQNPIFHSTNTPSNYTNRDPYPGNNQAKFNPPSNHNEFYQTTPEQFPPYKSQVIQNDYPSQKFIESSFQNGSPDSQLLVKQLYQKEEQIQVQQLPRVDNNNIKPLLSARENSLKHSAISTPLTNQNQNIYAQLSQHFQNLSKLQQNNNNPISRSEYLPYQRSDSKSRERTPPSNFNSQMNNSGIKSQQHYQQQQQQQQQSQLLQNSNVSIPFMKSIYQQQEEQKKKVIQLKGKNAMVSQQKQYQSDMIPPYYEFPSQQQESNNIPNVKNVLQYVPIEHNPSNESQFLPLTSQNQQQRSIPQESVASLLKQRQAQQNQSRIQESQLKLQTSNYQQYPQKSASPVDNLNYQSLSKVNPQNPPNQQRSNYQYPSETASEMSRRSQSPLGRGDRTPPELSSQYRQQNPIAVSNFSKIISQVPQKQPEIQMEHTQNQDYGEFIPMAVQNYRNISPTINNSKPQYQQQQQQQRQKSPLPQQFYSQIQSKDPFDIQFQKPLHLRSNLI